MTIESWANDPEIMGNFLKWPDNGELKHVVFLDDGVKTVIKGTEDKTIEFKVEYAGLQRKLSSSSKRLLKKLKEIAENNKNTLVGLVIDLKKTGDKFTTNYEVSIVAPIKPEGE